MVATIPTAIPLRADPTQHECYILVINGD
jgi:hypothetical protein